MRVNDELRTEIVRDSDLLTLERLNTDVPLYDNGNGAVLTLSPAVRPDLITQAEFNARWRRLSFHSVVDTVLDIPNICLCGGSVFRMFCGDGRIGNSDMDFYITGMDPDDEQSLWKKVDEFLAVFRDNNRSGFYLEESAVKIGKTVITVASDCVDEYAPKLQLILRVYPTIASVIQAFDVDPCCMAYDGETTYLTHAAARAVVTKCMILDPSRRSLTFESRLIKYMKRGLDLILPHFELNPSMVDTLVSMPHLEFTVNDVNGTVATVNIQPRAHQPASDYDILENYEGDLHYGLVRVVEKQNMENLVSDRHDRMFRVLTLADTRDVMRGVIERGYMTYNDILPVETLVNMYARAESSYYWMSLSNLSGLGVMTRLMGMSPSAAKRILDLIYANKVVDLSGVLEALRNKGTSAYDRLRSEKFEMWVKTEPGRQWTASMNPAFEDPTEYYGEFYCESPANVASSGHTSDDGIGPDDDVCMICHEVIRPGETNLMVLVCGHKMHMMPIRHKCLGGFNWISNHDDKCPMCRRSVRDTTTTSALPVRSSIRRHAVVPADVLDGN
eukprot:jgi/Tetstr1/463986/TSEL_008791.t1